MQRSELLAIVERLCDVDIDALERDELAEVVASAARVRGWIDATELRCARRGRKLADAGRAEPSSSLLARKGKRSGRDATQIDRREKVAEAMPTFEDGLDDGTVSAGHLDAIANATRNARPEVRAAFAAHEDELRALAAGDTVEVFTRRCRALVAQLTSELTGNDASELDRQRADSRIRTWVDPEDGMHHTHVALDPLRHEILWNAINRSLRRRQRIDGNARTPWNQMQVDALIDAVQGGTPDPRRHNRPTTPPTGVPTTGPAGARTTRPAGAPGPANGSTTGQASASTTGPAGSPTTGPTTAPTAGPTTAPSAAHATAPSAGPTTAPTAGPTTAPPSASDAATAERPPNPAADIARDLVDAVNRSTAPADHHQTFDPEASCAAPATRSGNDIEDGAVCDDCNDDADTVTDTDTDAVTDTDTVTDGDNDGDTDADNDGEESEALLRRMELRAPEISVLVDLAFLTGELHTHGICETEDGIPLPVSTMRRLCCDAEIIPLVLGGDGVALDVGRTARTVNRPQRRALRAMHRTCAHPDCNVPFSHTKIHHVRWWVRDRGPTDIENLLPLCERHHHLVHEGGWDLTMTADRIATWTRPDGVVAHRGCTIDRAPAPPPPSPPPRQSTPPRPPTPPRPQNAGPLEEPSLHEPRGTLSSCAT